MDLKRNDNRKVLILGLFALGLVPRCNCDAEPSLVRAPVEMALTLVEIDACSGAAIPRRIPDDYERLNLLPSTDFGSRAERVFEIRSTGTAPLTITEVRLSEADEEFELEVKLGPTDAAHHFL